LTVTYYFWINYLQKKNGYIGVEINSSNFMVHV
jgi:hypothetical protein